ncbi:hypothetical protein BcDW1_1162 [Botrytis cinerea BcDW1]|uniref:GmrSD restriction endonucleases N-terminal domain-containing protein n=1 Tax=Botryotinia fuckeliana (strain BcDW1) TaxID=1290391 RepID=M7V2C0_BOTF1|nr:hypothetical protein BcDW1_1162 [Botrytis cinerea BcDW1]
MTRVEIKPGSPVEKRLIKNEDSGDETLQLGLPDIAEDSIFDDVDVEDEESEYVDGNFEGLVFINGIEHFVCPGFKIRQLPAPMIVKRSLRMLYNTIVKGNLVLDPNYQRASVWDEGRASTLITSVLMGYFIPPIVLNVQTVIKKVKDGRKEVKHMRICVDGKQRLTSLFKFMSGEIGFLDNSHPPKKWYYCHPTINGVLTPTSSRNICPDGLKKFFDEKVFCCYEYDHLTQETEETMFQLVQRGIALSPAEKMRAMSTEWARFTRIYEDDYAMVVNCKSPVIYAKDMAYMLLVSKQSRASGFRLILTIFTMIQEVLSGSTNGRRKRTVPSLQASPQALMRVLEDPEPISMGLKLAFKDVFDRFESLIKLSSTKLPDDQYELQKNSVFDPAPEFLKEADVNHVRTFSPLELVATGILISYHKDRRSDDALLSDIKSLRRFLRLKHKDLRVNAQCWATAWEFISEHIHRNPNSQNNFALRLQSHREKNGSGIPTERGRRRARSNSDSSVLSSLDSLFEAEVEGDRDDSSEGPESSPSVASSSKRVLVDSATSGSSKRVKR